MSIGGKKFKITSSNGANDLLLDMVISSPVPNSTKKVTVKDALIDTGSDFTLIPSKYVKDLQLIYAGDRSITGVHNDTKKIKFYSANINIESIIDNVFDIGVSDDFDPIIGMNLIMKWQTLINGPDATFEIANSMGKAKKAKTPMEKLTQGYEKFIKDKESKDDGKSQFENTIKKAAKPKQRGSK